VSAVPSTAQVRAQVASLRERAPDERFIAIHFPAAWRSGESLLVRDETIPVRPCDSVLQLREALVECERLDGPVVFVTPLSEAELGADVLTRLARHRLFHVESWRIVRDLFHARYVDPRLADAPWIADVLLELPPGQTIPPVPSGVLDADTVWEILLKRIGFGAGRPDLVGLLRWTMETDVDRYLLEPEPLRLALPARLGESAGEAASRVLECFTEGSRIPLAVGLACGVVFHERGATDAGLQKASVRLEKYVGSRALPADVGRAWAVAAESVVERLVAAEDTQPARAALRESDEVLAEIGASQEAHLGRFSIQGFEQRVACLAESLTEALADRPGPEAERTLSGAVGAVARHGLAPWHQGRVERMTMALRLARWWSRRAQRASHGSFEAAARAYLAEGGLVDWARTRLAGGDEHPALSEAFGLLLQKADAEREKENRPFAGHLHGWLAAGGPWKKTIPVDQVLAEVVAPLAAEVPVLMLVIDGMAVAVFRQLLESLVADGWVPHLREAWGDDTPPVIAAMPSVTEVCRTSLFCGRLVAGGAADEKKGFAAFPALSRVSLPGSPPVLFGKAELVARGGAGVAAGVLDEVLSPERWAVAVIINAVDDQLMKGDQVHPRWTIDYVLPLGPLLHAARQAGRALVLVSDHGHVLERGTELRGDPASPGPPGAGREGGERWRPDAGDPGVGEVRLSGLRVIVPRGDSVIVPWSEGLRYGFKKNGYHGGAAPQEVVIPLGVFTPGDMGLLGWRERGVRYPPWWDEGARPQPPAQVPKKKPKKKVLKAQQAIDFGRGEAPPAPVPPTDWLAALFRSPIYAAQEKASGRMSLERKRVRSVRAAASSPSRPSLTTCRSRRSGSAA